MTRVALTAACLLTVLGAPRLAHACSDRSLEPEGPLPPDDPCVDLDLVDEDLEDYRVDRWEHDAWYFLLGIAPMSNIYADGFNPGLRYNTEIGTRWVSNRRRRRELELGADINLTQVFGRRLPAGGADVVMTGVMGPVYLRGGLGTIGALPRSSDPDDHRPAAGGLAGIGLQMADDDFRARIGVDYDFRMTTDFTPVHTVMVVLRLSWGFS